MKEKLTDKKEVNENIAGNSIARKLKFTDKQKKITLLVSKIIAVCIFAGIYSLMFVQKLYLENNETVWGRIVIATALFIGPSVLLFIKIKIPKALNLIISILFSGFVVVGNYVMLQMSQGFEYNLGIKLFVLNMAIIGTIFVVIYAIFNSFKVAIIGLSLLTTAYGISNYFVTMFRGTAMLAVDILNIETAANVAGGYTYTFTYDLYLMMISFMAVAFLAVKLGKNPLTETKKGKIIWRSSSAVCAICLVGCCYVGFFHSSFFDKTLKIKYYKPQETYAKNGMYATFIKSIKDLMVEEPMGYSIEAVEELAERYQGTSAKISAEESPNIIMIMDEAFTDFASFSDLKINKDCMPFFHSLNENTIKGQLFVSVFGGGTAGTEFESLTSNTMAFVPNGITVYTTYINDPMPSMATVLREQNYGRFISMHPYKPSGYKRDKVYPLLGFDEFISRDDFTGDIKYVGKFISDEADVDRIISEYEEHKESSDSPFYMFNVTMQNHSPFTAEGVSDDIKLEYDDINVPEANQYMNLMKYTDDALKKIVEYFEDKDEHTVIVFFGDHQPKLEDEFYDKIKEGYSLPEVYKEMRKYNTQFVIWANYDIEEQTDVYTSANYLSSMVLDVAGLAKNGYQQFVSEVQKEVPIITKHGYFGADGNFYENGDSASPYYDILQEYNILQYNNLFDVKNRVDSLFEIK